MNISQLEMPHRQRNLDLLRTIGILLVFIAHFSQLTSVIFSPLLAKLGKISIHYFFILSGYLVTKSFLSGPDTKLLPNYYIKRFFRILPSYFLILLVYAYLLYPEALRLEIWRYLIFSHNFNFNHVVTNFFPQAWTIAVEEQFYLTIPLIILLCLDVKKRKWIIPLLMILVLGSWASVWWTWENFIEPIVASRNYGLLRNNNQHYIYHPTYTNLGSLLSGTLVSLLWWFYPEKIFPRLQGKGKILFFSGIIILGASVVPYGSNWSFSSIVLGSILATCSLTLLLISLLPPMNVLKSCPDTFWFSRLSLEIYLTHYQVIAGSAYLFKWLGLRENSIGCFLFSLASTYLISFLIYRIINKPLIRTRDKILLRVNRLPSVT